MVRPVPLVGGVARLLGLLRCRRPDLLVPLHGVQRDRDVVAGVAGPDDLDAVDAAVDRRRREAVDELVGGGGCLQCVG